MSYTVKIINNDDGNVIVDREDVSAVIGSIAFEEGSASIGQTDCNSIELAQALATALIAIAQLEKEYPLVRELRKIALKILTTEDLGS